MADRVVGDRSQVHDSVKSHELRRSHITNVSRGPRRLRHRAEVTPFVPPSVQPDCLVAMVTEKRHQDRSDIAPVAGDENSLWHLAIILCTSRGEGA